MGFASIPMDTVVPISRFGKGGAFAEFAKVRDGVPVTVTRRGEPAYFIISPDDFRDLSELRRERASRGEGRS